MVRAPNRADGYLNLANYEIGMQRFDEARQIIQQAQARNIEDVILHNSLYALAFLASDSAGMAQQQKWYAGNADYQNFGLALQSDSEAYGGHLGKARELTRQAVESAVKSDGKENAAIYLAIAAQREAAFGNPAEARQRGAEALRLAAASQGAEVEAALAFALAGDSGRAESLESDLKHRYPLDTQMQAVWVPAIEGQLSLNRKRAPEALAALQSASAALEMGMIQFGINGSCLYPAYVRGEAYLADGKGDAAAAEFQKILDHGGLVWNCWTGALARLGVARANALQSRTSQGQGQGADADAARVRARTAYKEFLALWKDADSDGPILKEATAEYGKVQ